MRSSTRFRFHTRSHHDSSALAWQAAEIDTIDKQKSKLNEDRAHLKSLVIAHQVTDMDSDSLSIVLNMKGCAQ